MFKICRLLGLVFFFWFRVSFSHIREHKLKQGLVDIVDLICSCGTHAAENTEHYLLHCSSFTNQRTVLFDDLRNIGMYYGPLDASTFSRMLLLGNLKFTVNSGIIYLAIKFIGSTNGFSGLIYLQIFFISVLISQLSF